MVATFGLEEPSLYLMGETLHEMDLRDGRYVHPETAVIDGVLKGWHLMRFSDQDLEARGVALFERLYAAFARGGGPKPSRIKKVRRQGCGCFVSPRPS